MKKEKEIKTEKLSKTQSEIVELLKSGKWTIGYTSTFGGRCWMQKGGLGRSGDAKRVTFSTFWALQRKGFLKKISNSNYGIQEYKLKNKKV